MKKSKFVPLCVALSLFAIGCTSPADDKTAKTTETTQAVATKTDLSKLKSDIQALESSWAAADNARDTSTIVAFYADDAVSLINNNQMLVGKAAIEKHIKENFAKRAKGSTTAYDIMDVYGDENQVTEVGKVTIKDASGKIIKTGKYMAIWEKRNGKYVCIRDIDNDDAKEK